jgi:hypothetical protein
VPDEGQQNRGFRRLGIRQLQGDELLDALLEANRRGLLPSAASYRLLSVTRRGSPVQETIDEVYRILTAYYPDA